MTVKLLDDIIEAFIETNEHRSKHYTLEEILKISNYHEKEFRYFCADPIFSRRIPYIATINIIDDVDKDWIHIRLTNDKFIKSQYHSQQISNDLHKTRNIFANYLNNGEKVYERCRIYYNVYQQCIDVQFFAREVDIKNVLITFEHGHPDSEDESNIFSIL